MMQVQNAALFIDKSADEGDYGTPPQAVNYHIDKITLGYVRIYDPYSGKREGKLLFRSGTFMPNRVPFPMMESPRNRSEMQIKKCADGQCY